MTIIYLIITGLLVSLLNAQSNKFIDDLLTKEKLEFTELSLEDSLAKVFELSGIGYSIKFEDEELRKEFNKTNLIFTFNVGVPYEQLIRDMFKAATLNVQRNGLVWTIMKEPDSNPETVLLTRIYPVTNEAASVLKLIDNEGRVNRDLLEDWVDKEKGEMYSFELEMNVFVLYAHLDKHDAIDSLLKLHDQGFKIPSLNSVPKEEE